VTPLKVMFCGTGWIAIVPFIHRALEKQGISAVVSVRDRAIPLAPQLGEVDVALPSNARFGEEELAAAPRLRLIQQPAAGHEGIDKAAARARGIPVTNAPGANRDAVAQAALLLLLALARKLPRARKVFDQGVIGEPLGIGLEGKTLLVVGLGRTGSRLAEIAQTMGMEIVSVKSTDDRSRLLELLARAHAVSIHCPLTEATRGMFDDRAFAAMREGALLVNVARGTIVDRGALDRALASGKLGGVGLDVFWDEPWDPHDTLYARDDVVVLPHVAGSTEESFARIAEQVAFNVRALVDGSEFRNRVD